MSFITIVINRDPDKQIFDTNKVAAITSSYLFSLEYASVITFANPRIINDAITNGNDFINAIINIVKMFMCIK